MRIEELRPCYESAIRGAALEGASPTFSPVFDSSRNPEVRISRRPVQAQFRGSSR